MQHRDIFRSPFASPENFSRFYTVRATSRQHGESPALLDPLVNHFDDIDLASRLDTGRFLPAGADCRLVDLLAPLAGFAHDGLDVDLAITPHLCWLWRVDAPVAEADMSRKSGDDYAARVYLTFAVAPEALGFGTRVKLALARSIYGDQVPDAALNYVWDNRHAIGTLRDNAYTDRTRMLVLRSGAQDAGRWVLERRNVAEDFKLALRICEGLECAAVYLHSCAVYRLLRLCIFENAGHMSIRQRRWGGCG